jgi:hypothetical protein
MVAQGNDYAHFSPRPSDMAPLAGFRYDARQAQRWQ